MNLLILRFNIDAFHLLDTVHMEVHKNQQCTILDISHTVGDVSRYMTNLGREHWAAVKWVLYHLRGISYYCFTYNGCSDSTCGYVDSDFVSDLDKRRSTLGFDGGEATLGKSIHKKIVHTC